MESRLKEEKEGEEEELRDNVQQLERSLLSHSRKLVPWLNWDEWLFVEHSLFSDCPDTVALALRRVNVTLNLQYSVFSFLLVSTENLFPDNYRFPAIHVEKYAEDNALGRIRMRGYSRFNLFDSVG